jgi:hypothetical protein
MKTEVILYRQQLLQNPKFSVLVNYGWDFTGVWTTNEQGHLRNSLSTGAKTAFQSSILTQGVTYRLRFKLYNRTTGTLTVTNKASGTVHLSTTSNQIHIVEFTADGTDLIFNITNGFDGYISQTSLYQTPDKFSLDLTEDVSIPLNYSIDDVFNVAQRKAPFSQTISLPPTHNNNLAFNQIYKLNSESLMNPNLKSRVIIKNSGITVFDGDLCLDNVIKYFDGTNVIISEYKVQFIGKIIGIVQLLDTLTVQDLDFSEYNHVYGLERVFASYNDDIVINGNPSQPNTITTYTSPNISSFTTVTVDGHKHPKITFASAHNLNANDEIFVPFGTDFSAHQTILEVPSSTEITLRATKGTNFAGVLSGNVTNKMLTGIGYFYPSCDYGSIHGPVEVGIGAPLIVGEKYLIHTYVGGDDFTNVGAGSNASKVVFTATGSTPNSFSGSTLVQLKDFAGGFQAKTLEQSNSYYYVTDFIPHIFLREIFQKMMALVGIDYELPFDEEKFWRRIIIPCNQDKFKYEKGQHLIDDGDVLNFNDILPPIKLKDIFLAVIQAFNLGAIQDSDIPSKIQFVERNTFFDNPPIDWTHKLDTSKQKPLEIDFLNNALPKTYRFKYKDSQDTYNLDYVEDFGAEVPLQAPANPINRNYGDKYIEVRSDYLTSEQKIELIFEPTVLGYNTLSDMVNSKCFFDSGTSGNVERKYSPRILFAGYRGILNFKKFNLLNEISQSGAMHLGLNWYPTAGHIANIDDLYPDWDLNFGELIGFYFENQGGIELPPGGSINIGDENWGRNNLYNKHWKRFVEATTDKNSRLVTGTFKLSVIDIYELDFSKPIRVADFVLKLNKVTGWDVNGDGLCKCEFLLKTI